MEGGARTLRRARTREARPQNVDVAALTLIESWTPLPGTQITRSFALTNANYPVICRICFTPSSNPAAATDWIPSPGCAMSSPACQQWLSAGSPSSPPPPAPKPPAPPRARPPDRSSPINSKTTAPRAPLTYKQRKTQLFGFVQSGSHRHCLVGHCLYQKAES